MQRGLNFTIFLVFHESHGFQANPNGFLEVLLGFQNAAEFVREFDKIHPDQMLRRGFNTDSSSLWAATLV